jgi:hypothetical protein
MKITLNHSRLGVSSPPVLPTKPSWNVLRPLHLKAATLVSKIVLGVVLFYLWPGGIVTAQLRFVQLTDPHVFDESERQENKQIFVDAIWEINKLKNKVDFVVVTGDLGVESIVENKRGEAIEEAINNEADWMADNILALSEVKLWLFVPGNNDLVNELPHTIEYYRKFIERLNKSLKSLQIEVRDLTLDGPNDPFTLKDRYVFIGLNNASFKNNNSKVRLPDPSALPSPDECENQTTKVESCLNFSETKASFKNNNSKVRLPKDVSAESSPVRKTQNESTSNITETKDQPTNCSSALIIRCFQNQEFTRISSQINLAKERHQFVYIFYHIPEVDDPYLISDYADWKLYDFRRNRHAAKEITRTNNSDNVNSSWFVDHVLRERWEGIVNPEHVKGLFAGHLHDNNIATYQQYPDKKHQKLYICPPLAIKLQGDKNFRARGFRVVDINEQGDVGPNGSETNKLYWYDDDKFTFATQPPPAEGGSMSWEKWAHISTVLQLVLLAISLALVWIQLKQQTDLARAANTQSLVGLASPFNLEVSQSKDMANLWLNGPAQLDKFSEVEKEQYESLLRWWFIFYENVFFQGKRKLLDEPIYNSWMSDLKTFLEDQRVEMVWARGNEHYHREFVA